MRRIDPDNVRVRPLRHEELLSRGDNVVSRSQESRQHVIDLLNRPGHTQLAEEASRVLPDPVDEDQAAAWSMQHGFSRDDLISEMGGSP